MNDLSQDPCDVEGTTPSAVPTMKFWNRLGFAAMILAMCVGVGSCCLLADISKAWIK